MTVGVQQGCPLSPVLFYIYIDIYISIFHKALTLQHLSENDCFAQDAVEDAEEIDTTLSSVSIGGRPLCNSQFADDNNLLGDSEEKLQQLTERLEKLLLDMAWKSAPTKAKILVNSIKPRPSTNISTNGKMLEDVDQFKYLGSTQTKDGTSTKEVKIRLAQAFENNCLAYHTQSIKQTNMDVTC